MATIVFPVCGTTQGQPDTSGDAELRAVAVLTSSYVATTNAVNAKGWPYVTFKIVYTKGDETTAQMKIEGSSDGGTTWFPIANKATQAAGVAEVSVDVLQLTGTQSVALPTINRAGHALLRMSVKATGGTPTGTMGVYASGSIHPVVL
jgi:hypothetical protein